MNAIENNNSIAKNEKISVIDLVLTSMFTAIICVMAIISIPTQPIPFTLAVLAIFLTGALLSPRNALFAVLAYILLGAFGLPVFANFKGGVHILFGMTGGYIMAYPLMTFIPALCYKYFKKRKTVALTIGMLISLMLCYLIGTLWFVHLTGNGFYTALTLCVFPYVLFDLIKIGLAISFSTILRKTALKQFYSV